MSLVAGSTFAGFKVLQLLGSGAMGEVYLVEHPRLPRREALKILTSSASSDPQYRDRFMREAELVSGLWHPNVIAIHDRGEVDGLLWISMDYVEGQDAAALVRANPGGLPVADVSTIATAVASALDYAHARGLLHRDVKPANIMLGHSDHSDRRILLADFGIARHTADPSGLTATNAAVGTIAYAPPEQLLGENVDARSDQYGLAATVFHLLTGNPPFSDANPAVVIGKHLNATPPRLSAHRPELWALDAVFTRALAKAPADRFLSCTDFAQALAESVTRPPAPPAGPPMAMAAPIEWQHPAPPVFTAPPPARRPVVALAVMLVLVVLALGAGAFTLTQYRRPVPQGTTAISWQPYVDFGRTFAERMMSLSPASVDSTIQYVIDNSTGDFQRDFTSQREDFAKTARDAGATTTATVSSIAVKSFDAQSDTAVLLVAAEAKVTNNNGQNNTPRNWRLLLTIKKVDGTLKTSNVEFAS